MTYTVLMTADAAYDLEQLHQFVCINDSPGKARQLLNKIEKVFKTLSENPERGVYPKELLALGIRDYRQIHFKPYRIIYRVASSVVYVMIIADGRRDMQTLLQQRLFSADQI